MMTTKIAAAFFACGFVLIAGAPITRAEDGCTTRVNELERQVRELQEQIASMNPEIENAETRRASTGAVFTEVTHPGFGEAWRDPSGMIWGDLVVNKDGSRSMSHSQATAYCRRLGARLPSHEDFVRLRTYLGARAGTYKGYKPQVLPSLLEEVDDPTYAYTFWSSTPYPGHSGSSYVFFGHSGYLEGFIGEAYDSGATRCVTRL